MIEQNFLSIGIFFYFYIHTETLSLSQRQIAPTEKVYKRSLRLSSQLTLRNALAFALF